jgi:hypothetical protein
MHEVSRTVTLIKQFRQTIPASNPPMEADMTRILPTILLAAGLASIALPAIAIERISIAGMDCQTIRSTLATEGAAILRHASARVPGMTLFDRYVRNAGYCPSGMVGEWRYLPASDTKSCRVMGCKPYEPREDPWRKAPPSID